MNFVNMVVGLLGGLVVSVEIFVATLAIALVCFAGGFALARAMERTSHKGVVIWSIA